MLGITQASGELSPLIPMYIDMLTLRYQRSHFGLKAKGLYIKGKKTEKLRMLSRSKYLQRAKGKVRVSVQ